MTTTTAPAATEEKVAQLRQQITEGVAALVSSDAWRAMLETASRFHQYSVNNLLLIGAQAPHATRVAGFRTWQGLGRQVRRGEKGIAILAPCTYRPKTSEQDAGGEAEQGTGGERNKERGAIRGVRRVHVFDLAQTEGEPLAEVRGMLLTGDGPVGLWEALAAQVATHGYTLERGDCGRANGYTDPTTRRVRVRGDVDDAQAVKTLAHELAHIECGHVVDLPTYATCRDQCEVEAESVAYVVTAAAGLDTASYSFAYVANWAGGDLATVRGAAEVVTKAARAILARLDEATSPPADVAA